MSSLEKGAEFMSFLIQKEVKNVVALMLTQYHSGIGSRVGFVEFHKGGANLVIWAQLNLGTFSTASRIQPFPFFFSFFFII